MADVDPKPIGMMNPASRFYNDNIPAKSPLKKAAEEKMQKRFAGRPMLSQYAPQLGEMERMNAAKNQKMEEQQMLLNKLASSPMMEKAMNNLVEPMLALESMGLLGGLVKSGLKGGLKGKMKGNLLSDPVIVRGPIPNPYKGTQLPWENIGYREPATGDLAPYLTEY
jgi:hypothetical protein